MKKVLAFVLIAMLTLALPMSVQASDLYDDLEPLELWILSIDNIDKTMEAPLVIDAQETLNTTFRIQLIAGDWGEYTRTLAATDMLPDCIAWYTLGYHEYRQMAEQGILGAFPKLDKFPNLVDLYNSKDIFPYYVMPDGELYAFPKVDNTQPYSKVNHSLFLYRRDWSEQLGYNFAPVQDITWDELMDYCEDVLTNDPGEQGHNLVVFDGHGNSTFDWRNLAKQQWSPWIDTFYLADDGSTYLWGAEDPRTVTAIENVQWMYQKGYLYKEGYADTGYEGSARFNAGMSAIKHGPNAGASLSGSFTNLKEAVDGFPDEGLGLFAVKQADGKYHVLQSGEYWCAWGFSANASDEVKDRFCTVANWLLEDAQIEKYAYGVPGEDFTIAADGTVTLNWVSADRVTDGPKEYINYGQYFQKWFMLEGCDLFLPNNPSVNHYAMDTLYKGYFTHIDGENLSYFPTANYDVALFNGPVFSQFGTFSQDLAAAFMTSIISNSMDEWDAFVASNKPYAEQIIAELNEAYIK